MKLTDSHLDLGRGRPLPLPEVKLSTSRSSGPGGQHANKTESRVEASFDVNASDTLSDAQKARIVRKLGPVVRAVSQDARSQMRNRELALLRLGEKLDAALTVRRNRVATKPTKASRERRLQAKRSQAAKKSTRRRPPGDDD